MKKVLFLIVLCIFMFSLLSINAFATTEYSNKGFNFEIPDGLIYDGEWAEENSYVGYWHSDDYDFEVLIWIADNISFDIIPSSSSKLCFHDGTGESVTLKKDRSGTEYINSLLCSHYIGELYTDDEYLSDYELFDFENGGIHYMVRFAIHDEKYEYFVNEIMQTFKIVKDFSFSEWIDNNLTWGNLLRFLFYFAVALLVLRIIEKKRQKHQQ